MVQVRKLGLVIRDLKIFENPAVEFFTANTAYRFNFRRLARFLSGSESVGVWLELVYRVVCLDPTEHFII